MTGGVALQAVLSGLAEGAVYGLVAMGFTLVWRLTRVFAFAHGDLVVGAVFVAVLAVLGSTPVASAPSGFDATALVVLTLAAGALLSGLTYIVAVRPFVLAVPARSSSSVVGWVVGGIAAGLAVRELLGLVFSEQAYAIPDPLHLSSLTDSGVVDLPGDTTIPVRAFGVLAIGVVVAVVVQLLLVRGRRGLALRAVSEDPEAASLMGVSVERVVLSAFLVAGALAGLAGLLDAPDRALTVDAGVILGLKGAAAAFIGRLGSLPGALAGGLVLGVGEALAVAWDALGAQYADVLPLAVLVAVVALRPEGLGRRVAEPVE
jgi:branched-subunit amino acid ABC-type transport system permease component